MFTVVAYMAATATCAQWSFTLDQGFRTQIQEKNVNSIALMPDGNLLISGRIRFPGDMSDRGSARLLPNGQRDPSFQGFIGGGVIVPWNDRFYVGIGLVRRLLENGLNDPSFITQSFGPYFSSHISGDYHVYPDGRILMSGKHLLSDSIRGFEGYYNMIWFSNEGYLDTTRTHRKGNGEVNRFYELPTGQFICSGTCTEFEGVPVDRIFRVNAVGAPDTTFRTGVYIGGARAYLPLPDGRVYVGGNFRRTEAPADTLRLVRFMPDGSLDPTFSIPQFTMGGQGITAALSSAINTYEGVVDLGQKVDVVEAIRQYPAILSHALRDVLLAHYPLSDEVLKETILRAEPLDPWHLTQVLIANSPLNGWVFQALDEADLLSSYFRHLVKQAQAGEIGVKRLLELEVLQRQQEKDLLLIRLLDAWASDTIHAQKADSVMALLNADGTGYGAQGAYLQSIVQGDHTEAASMAGSLNAFSGNADLIEYGTLLSQADGEWIALMGNEATLRRMAFDHSPGSGAMAWGALLAMHELDSVPMPPLPGMMKSLMPQRPPHSRADDTPLLSVLPNPASDRIAYVTPLSEGFGYGVLEIFDAQGHVVQAIPLNGSRGLLESTVAGWRPGLYMVRLVVDGGTVGSAKFTVVR